MRERPVFRSLRPKVSQSTNAGFYVGGYDELLVAIEAEIRPEVLEKYAEEWNTASVVKRWILKKKIEREIAKLVSVRSSFVSRDALF